MNEIWPFSGGYVVYTEDLELCKKFNKSKDMEWFGTYFRGQVWFAKQFKFPKSKLAQIKRLTGVSVTPY